MFKLFFFDLFRYVSYYLFRFRIRFLLVWMGLEDVSWQYEKLTQRYKALCRQE